MCPLAPLTDRIALALVPFAPSPTKAREETPTPTRAMRHNAPKIAPVALKGSPPMDYTPKPPKERTSAPLRHLTTTPTPSAHPQPNAQPTKNAPQRHQPTPTPYQPTQTNQNPTKRKFCPFSRACVFSGIVKL